VKLQENKKIITRRGTAINKKTHKTFGHEENMTKLPYSTLILAVRTSSPATILTATGWSFIKQQKKPFLTTDFPFHL